MPEVTLERVAEEARSLTAQEQEQLRRMLDSWLTESPVERKIANETEEAKEQLLMQHLLEKGIIARIPTREPLDDNYVRHAPIVVKGEPVSETIIRERR